ncbi:hypothetical protein B0T22DRAFT_443275 [Podospora appendiculata]|uniref:Uncharacterized protein n=1 Tax=Podospora appendiculata TaxID=314037 RepID=A0AAE0X7F6_9PEZI|nr:hypothetical protein B0T22DRAFT_443275 [Podospora appendiculata]
MSPCTHWHAYSRFFLTTDVGIHFSGPVVVGFGFILTQEIEKLVFGLMFPFPQFLPSAVDDHLHAKPTSSDQSALYNLKYCSINLTMADSSADQLRNVDRMEKGTPQVPPVPAAAAAAAAAAQPSQPSKLSPAERDRLLAELDAAFEAELSDIYQEAVAQKAASDARIREPCQCEHFRARLHVSSQVLRLPEVRNTYHLFRWPRLAWERYKAMIAEKNTECWTTKCVSVTRHLPPG